MQFANWWRLAALAGAMLAGLNPPTSVIAAESGGLSRACWDAASLAGRPDEHLSRWQRAGATAPARPQLAATPASIVGTVRRVKLPPGRKLVALTFDLCESALEIAGYDGGVIDYLRANKVKATLFAGGKWMVSHGERTAQLMADPLFEIGTHGWAHANPHVTSGQALDDEIDGAIAAFTDARQALAARECASGSSDLARIPESPPLFRFPFGACDAEALASVARAGQLAIQWDVVTGDPDRAITPDAIARAVLAETRPGSIIVAHANGRGVHTAAALPLFVPQLRARGFEFVTVGELLAAGTPEIAPTCYERHPGDNQRYDVARLRKDRSPSSPGQPHRQAPQSWPVQVENWPPR
jgi:peptidoglycan/xylan/chitin deacetylase (PgdA/CDA1 family)